MLYRGYKSCCQFFVADVGRVDLPKEEFNELIRNSAHVKVSKDRKLLVLLQLSKMTEKLIATITVASTKSSRSKILNLRGRKQQ